MVELHRGAEDPPDRRNDAQLDLLVAAAGDELGEEALVEGLERDDDPVADEQAAAPVAEGRAERAVLADDGGVHVGEEVELPADGAAQALAADDDDAFGRRDPPPEKPGEAAKSERREQREHERANRDRRRQAREPRELEEHGQARETRDRPDEDDRQLIDRQVPERAVVAVVEAVQLGGEDPGREEEEGTDGRPSAGGGDREVEGDRDRRADVGECEHPSTQRIARGPQRGAARGPGAAPPARGRRARPRVTPPAPAGEGGYSRSSRSRDPAGGGFGGRWRCRMGESSRRHQRAYPLRARTTPTQHDASPRVERVTHAATVIPTHPHLPPRRSVEPYSNKQS